MVEKVHYDVEKNVSSNMWTVSRADCFPAWLNHQHCSCCDDVKTLQLLHTRFTACVFKSFFHTNHTSSQF